MPSATRPTIRDLRAAADAAVSADLHLSFLRAAYEHAAGHASAVDGCVAWEAYQAARAAHPVAGPAWRAWHDAALGEMRERIDAANAERVLDAETE